MKVEFLVAARVELREAKEYDFSRAERAKFYRAGVKLNLPIYLGEGVQRYVVEKARSKGIGVDQFVSEILKRQAEAEGYSVS